MPLGTFPLAEVGHRPSRKVHRAAVLKVCKTVVRVMPLLDRMSVPVGNADKNENVVTLPVPDRDGMRIVGIAGEWCGTWALTELVAADLKARGGQRAG